jgi:hypothetical protein
MNRRDFIAGAVGGLIVGAGVGYSIGKRKCAGEPEPAPTQSDALPPAVLPTAAAETVRSPA